MAAEYMKRKPLYQGVDGAGFPPRKRRNATTNPEPPPEQVVKYPPCESLMRVGLEASKRNELMAKHSGLPLRKILLQSILWQKVRAEMEAVMDHNAGIVNRGPAPIEEDMTPYDDDDYAPED